MKAKLLFLLLSIAMFCQAQDKYYPVAVWPFIYENFTDARIFVGQDNKVVRAKANIHLRHTTLWFISAKDFKTKLEAQPGTVNKIIFSNGDTYYNIDNKMCKVVREDTINGDIMRLYKCSQVDMDDFNKKYQMTHMGTVESSVLGAGFADFSTSVANINALTREDMEPLQTKNTFYILKDGETFEARESEILSHLKDKEERRVYRGFTRSAEILYGSENSMLNVYKTFFLKQ
jgi:hypothetical protein